MSRNVKHIEEFSPEAVDMSLNRVERRVAGRRMAAELTELIGDDVHDPHFMESLCETLKALAFPPGSQQPELLAKHEPIARLGATKLTFGMHEGKSFDDTPLEYLDWLCRSNEDTLKALKAYLTHPDLTSRRRGLDC